MTKTILPADHKKKRRSVMITPDMIRFIESLDPLEIGSFPRGFAELLRLGNYRPSAPAKKKKAFS